MALPGRGTSSAAAKVKGVAICSVLLNITCQILSMILMMGLLSSFMENIKTFAKQSGGHDIEFPETSAMMMMNNMPRQFIFFVVAMALPAAGFLGASRMHKDLIKFFFACSLVCACCQLCNCVMLAGIVSVTGPLGDRVMDEFQICNMYQHCNVYEIPFKQHKPTTDCILASVWPQYHRQFPGFGHPASPERCSAFAYTSLVCYEIPTTTSTTSTTSTTENASSSISSASHHEPEPIWQRPAEPIWQRPAEPAIWPSTDAEIRRLLSQPVSEFDQDWAHSLSLAISGKRRRLRDELLPSMPNNPLQACEVDVEQATAFSQLLDLVETELPTIKFISIISMLVSLLTACVNCAGGFFGKQLHDECWAVQPTPLQVGSLTAPMAPQVMMTGGVSITQNEMMTVPPPTA